MTREKSKIRRQKGLIIVYTGEGKGKTTAAIGLAMRTAGWEKKIAIIQFIKGFKETGEWKLIKNIDQIDIYQTIESETAFIGKPEKKHEGGCKKAVLILRELITSGKHDVLILDEINNAIFYDLVEVGEIIKILKKRSAGQTVVFTGRNAAQEIIEIADLVTEMKKIKHPYDKGIQAKRGIDY
jgi:cob(I)alamin adenosyltransferase